MVEITTASAKLIPFTASFEGTVLKAYRDPGGVITIGIGATWLSAAFRNWWTAKRGHKLRMGDTMTAAEAREALSLLIAKEYAPPVAKRFKGTGIRQHEFDAATDVSYNCGPGSLKWTWAAALAGRAIEAAAARLCVTAITAKGKRLNGLVRRRIAEARLMETGYYGVIASAAGPSVSTSTADIREYQSALATLGYYAGAIDGVRGNLTDAAVLKFQSDNDLIVDGIVGPATRATLQRALEAKRAVQSTATATGATGATGAGMDISANGIDWSAVLSGGKWAVVALVVAAVAVIAWRYRGVILRKRTRV